MNSRISRSPMKRKLQNSDDVSPTMKRSRINKVKLDDNLNVVQCSLKSKQSDLRRFFLVKDIERKKRKTGENTGIITYKIP